MDVHPGLGDATPEDVAAAHRRDLEIQGKYGVTFLTYWFNGFEGKAFCLVESPDAETATACHKEAHGLMPHDIIEVDPPSMSLFLGEWETNDADRAMVPGLDSQPDTGLRAIMFTDIEGSTDLSTTLGDDAAMQAVRTHDAIVRECLARTSGREVKHTGDGILACFTSVTGAVEAAVTIQERTESEEVLAVKIGMSAGEPVEESEDLYGASVNLAARICAHAAGGQTLVAGTIRDLAIGKGLEFHDQGHIALKGFAEPVRLFEIAGKT
jgi:class 3 adenylate cyclase